MKGLSFAALASWLISGAVGLTLAAPAHAACNGTWDLTGDWSLNQANGYAFNLRIKAQNGNNLYGDAKTSYGERQFFSGTFNGQYIEMTIPATGGVYSGGIDDRGHIGGTTHNPDNTESTEWWGDRAATCIPTASPPAPATACASGYVWRERFEGDVVCVKPEERFRLADGTCRSGYVWRDATPGDNVCVTPAQRALAKDPLNRAGVSAKPGTGGDILKETKPCPC